MTYPNTDQHRESYPIYLILPAHNEEKNIVKVVRGYASYFQHPYSRFHIVVNNSQDDTYQLVQSLAAHDPRIITSDIEAAIGKGGAILFGLHAFDGATPYVGFVDADGAISPQEYEKLIISLAKDQSLGMAISSRWMKGAKLTIRQPLTRQISSRLFNFFVRLIFLFPYKDTQCGAKVFTAGVWQTLRPRLSETSFVFDIQLLWLAKKHGIKVKEIPIEWRDRPDSSVNVVKNAFPLLKALLRIRFSSTD